MYVYVVMCVAKYSDVYVVSIHVVFNALTRESSVQPVCTSRHILLVPTDGLIELQITWEEIDDMKPVAK